MWVTFKESDASEEKVKNKVGWIQVKISDEDKRFLIEFLCSNAEQATQLSGDVQTCVTLYETEHEHTGEITVSKEDHYVKITGNISLALLALHHEKIMSSILHEKIMADKTVQAICTKYRKEHIATTVAATAETRLSPAF